MHSDGIDCHTDWERGRLEEEGDESLWGMLSLRLSRDGQVDLLLGSGKYSLCTPGFGSRLETCVGSHQPGEQRVTHRK